MKSVDLMSLWNAVCSVLLCLSVRKRIIARLAGEVFSLTERTEFTEVFGTHFEPTERLRHTEFTERYSYQWGEI